MTAIEDYLRDLSSRLHPARRQDYVHDEVEDHLRTTAEALVREGFSDADAAQEAIRRIGPADSLARQLTSTFPRPPSLLGGLTCLRTYRSLGYLVVGWPVAPLSLLTLDTGWSLLMIVAVVPWLSFSITHRAWATMEGTTASWLLDVPVARSGATGHGGWRRAVDLVGGTVLAALLLTGILASLVLITVPATYQRTEIVVAWQSVDNAVDAVICAAVGAIGLLGVLATVHRTVPVLRRLASPR
ncbi:MAG: permease prefix domain 1-containing protein [Phycicoccus sp.]